MIRFNQLCFALATGMLTGNLVAGRAVDSGIWAALFVLEALISLDDRPATKVSVHITGDPAALTRAIHRHARIQGPTL